MTPFEYALGLISILMSLALADLVMSFHRLMRHARTVRWDGRVLLAAVLVIVEIIRIWFAQWTLRDLDVALSFPVYVGLFSHILLLVLAAAACLPDDADEGCDLTDFYERNRRYFWCVLAAANSRILRSGSYSAVIKPRETEPLASSIGSECWHPLRAT